MKKTLLIFTIFFICSSAFSQKKIDSIPAVKHDTTFVLEINAKFWQALQEVVKKSNAEHLLWEQVNEYLFATDPKKNHIKMVVDSTIKK
jgi:hypothetical protein